MKSKSILASSLFIVASLGAMDNQLLPEAPPIHTEPQSTWSLPGPELWYRLGKEHFKKNLFDNSHQQLAIKYLSYATSQNNDLILKDKAEYQIIRIQDYIQDYSSHKKRDMKLERTIYTKLEQLVNSPVVKVKWRSLNRLADLYFQGRVGLDQRSDRYEIAYDYFSQVANQNQHKIKWMAYVYLGHMYEEKKVPGISPETSDSLVHKYYMQAYNQNENIWAKDTSAYSLGLIYFYGWHGVNQSEKHDQLAKNYFEHLASHARYELYKQLAQYQLGMLYKLGRTELGISQEGAAQAYKYFKQAVAGPNANTQIQAYNEIADLLYNELVPVLGNKYEQFKVALRLYKYLLDHDSNILRKEAHFRLGIAYHELMDEKQPTKADIEQAIEHFQFAAAQDDDLHLKYNALGSIGQLYVTYANIFPDKVSEAISLLEQVLNQEISLSAQSASRLFLGYLYSSLIAQDKVKPNLSLGLTYLTQVANEEINKKSQSSAAFDLGYLYFYGMNEVVKDEAKGLAYFSQAVRSGALDIEHTHKAQALLAPRTVAMFMQLYTDQSSLVSLLPKDLVHLITSWVNKSLETK